MQQELKLESHQHARILSALTKAGYKVEQKNGLMLIQCPRYTVTCYYSEEFKQWRLTPYDERAQRNVREALR
jgi:hypothetical protein